MKTNLMKMLGLCSVAFAMTALADDTAQTVTAPVSAVAAASQGAAVLNGKINAEAQVYFYLHSASWCGPCRRAMPGVVTTYAEMKADGRGEIILINYDKTPEGAKKYIDSYKTDMPTLHISDPKVATLPGFTRARAIPFVIAVDAQGNVLAKGAPAVILQWKTLVK